MSTRKQIRDAVKTIIEGISGNSGKVYAYQRETISTGDFAILVHLDEGDNTHNVGVIVTNAELTVRVMTPAPTHIDDALDVIGEPVEAAILADPTLGDLAISCRLSRWSYDRDQDDAMTALTLTYNVRYKPQ